MDTDILRIIDANLNRAKEGLRAAEDFARFILADTEISDELKALRHELFSVYPEDFRKQILAFRDSINDPGAVGQESGRTKTTSDDVASANIKRAEEALRSLEEYTKTFSEEQAGLLKGIRFRLYTAEKKLFYVFPRLKESTLYIILTESLCSASYEDTVKMLIDGGADIIQVREKNIEAGELKEKVQTVQELLEGSDILLTVNDRPDVGRITKTNGVHTGQGDMSVADTRRVYPHGLVGLSTHSPKQAEQANIQKPDYIGVGPVFATPTKKGRPGIGIDAMQKMLDIARMPGFVIGGISRETVFEVIKAGAQRIAVCTAVISAENPLKECTFFKKESMAGK